MAKTSIIMTHARTAAAPQTHSCAYYPFGVCLENTFHTCAVSQKEQSATNKSPLQIHLQINLSLDG